MRVAVVHDWLVVRGGAERVLEQMLHVFPQADLYSVLDFLPPEARGFLGERQVRTTFVQRLPFARSKYRWYLSLMPLAIEQFDMSAYDLVLSSSYAVSKGVLTGPRQRHLSYVHSPMRYAWDLQHQYLRETGLDRGLVGWLARWQLSRLRIWDQRTAHGVDRMLANSHFVAQRIRKAYGREAGVLFPPVDLGRLAPGNHKDEYYVTVSRMVPYKRIDAIVAAFNLLPDRRLVVIGDGPDAKKIAALAGKNVELLGEQSDDEVRAHLQAARAFIFAAEEDFGIAPVEAQACGTPVVAFGKGGALESIRGLSDRNPTGVFFFEQTPEAIAAAVRRFETAADRIDPAACRRNAMRFSNERFRDALADEAAKLLEAGGAEGWRDAA